MRRLLLIAACLLIAAPALALDLPTRKAGLWEVKMEFQGHSNLPVQTMQQCTDAASDKLMTYNFGGFGPERLLEAGHKQYRRHDRHRLGLQFGGASSTSHAVVSGDFNSAYTVTSPRHAKAAGRCRARRPVARPT